MTVETTARDQTQAPAEKAPESQKTDESAPLTERIKQIESELLTLRERIKELSERVRR